MIKWAWVAPLALVMVGCSNSPQQNLNTKSISVKDSEELVVPELEVEPLVPVMVEEPEPEVEQVVELTPAEVDNLWVRISMQFEMEPSTHPRVQSQKEWYLKHPTFMTRVSKRAEPFLYHVVTELEARDMPLEIALLPVVESAFDPFAYSHGRAAGMWQFVPITAQRFKLKNNWWYDGRRDVYASTNAALDYLEYLHRFFDGNWEHALAAYNAGEGRVRNAIRANKAAGKPTDFWSLNLPRETQHYVPKLLALADIMANIDDYGMKAPMIANEPVIREINIGSQLDLAMAAKMMDIETASLQQLNPGLNRWATSPDGPHRLVVPYHKADEMERELANLPKEKRLNWVRYEVQKGDSLSTIASKHNTQVTVLRDINQLQGNLIRIGQPLLIPIASAELSDYSLSEDQRVARHQNRSRSGTKIDYVVRSGDSFWKIAQAHNVEVRSLASWNKMAPNDPLRVGQRLVIWSKVEPKNGVTRKVTYTVRSGDSIARIAQRFNVRTSDVMRWNNLDPKRYLQPGQRLQLYVDVTKA